MSVQCNYNLSAIIMKKYIFNVMINISLLTFKIDIKIRF